MRHTIGMSPKYFQNISLHFFCVSARASAPPMSKYKEIRKNRFYVYFGGQCACTKKIATTVIFILKVHAFTIDFAPLVSTVYYSNDTSTVGISTSMVN